MIRQKKYSLTEKEKLNKAAKRAALIQEKEKVYLSEPWQGYCDNNDHPLFSIKVTVDKPYGVCYYCSKMWILKKDD